MFGLAAVLAAAGMGSAQAAERMLDRSVLSGLSALKPGESLVVDTFPAGPTKLASVRFERIALYSADAHVYVETATGRAELPRSSQIFLRGYSDDGKVRVALALNPDLTVAHGNGSGSEGSFVLHAVHKSGAAIMVAQPLEADLPAGFNFDYRCGNENEKLDLPALNAATTQMRTALAAQASTASSSLRLAVVAVDTDSLFMSSLFANNTTSASNWIAGMFNTMNLMYERDLQVKLQIGTTILRTSAATDPYVSLTTNATQAGLDLFASYWKTNESTVPRAFAVLLSGAIPKTQFGCSASGIAWVDQYCQNGFTSNSHTVGSYSLTEVCTNISVDPNGAFDARIVGHEVGHNFGAYHTHCTNLSTAAAPTASNTIDQCFNTESSCYSGTPACPAAGAGTIMSYCNVTNVSGCASNTQNLLQFHSTHIAQLENRITAAPSGCLTPNEIIFLSGFD